MEPLYILLASVAIIFLAGTIQGLAGFGFSQFALPWLVLLITGQELIPIMVVLSLFLNVFLIYELRKFVNLKRIWPLIVGGALGIPLGTYLLLITDVKMMKLLIGFIIIIFSLALFFEIRKTIKKEKEAMLPIGFLAGVLNSIVTISAPPLIIFFSNQEMNKQEFRANLITFFLFINILTLPVFFYAGLMTTEVITTSGLLIPGMVLGAFTGSKLANKIDEARFKKLIMILIIIMGSLLIASGLGLF